MKNNRVIPLTLEQLNTLHQGLASLLCQAKAKDIEATVALLVRLQRIIEAVENTVTGHLEVEWASHVAPGEMEQPLAEGEGPADDL